MNILNKLSDLTNNFTDKNIGIKCPTVEYKNKVLDIAKSKYNGVFAKPKDGYWLVVCGTPKNINESLLTEDDDINDFDLSDLDDNDDISYKAEFSSESTEDANQLTVLKSRASKLAKQWQDTFNQISVLAKKLNLVAKHDDEFNIELKKLDKDTNKFEDEDEIDDTFGPSDFDDRATKLGKDVPIDNKNDATSNFDPNELPLADSDVDDDF